MASESPRYPVSLDVARRKCIVVGGGAIATRKAEGLVHCGASVTVVAPSMSATLDVLGAEGRIVLERRPYRAGEAAHFRLALAATGDPDVDRLVADDADAAGVWVDSASDAARCTFLLPAVHRDGPVTIAVSTGGASPALAAWLRDRIAARCGPGMGSLATLLAQARQRFTERGVDSASVDWRQALDGPLPDLVAEGRLEEAQQVVDGLRASRT